MIIWINGPFGAGKTTLAKRLRDRRSKSLIFDPEEIGFVVKETVPMPASGDYQDLPLWRGLTIAAVREIRRNYSGTVAKLAMRQPFVLFKGLTFQKLCL
ncbi:AAA family ATPase, partial [Escherichia coli]|nr:AAA family ATPase [Escherichia coli]